MLSILIIIGSSLLGLIVCFIGWFFYPLIQDANIAAALLLPSYGLFRLIQWLYIKNT